MVNVFVGELQIALCERLCEVHQRRAQSITSIIRVTTYDVVVVRGTGVKR